MKYAAALCFLLAGFTTSAQTLEKEIRDLKEGRVEEDMSYVYSLPFQKGKTYLLIQAYYSNLSHKGEYALDFKMKKGSGVCAARGGIVEAVRGDSRKGGLQPKYLSEGNFVVIRHEDGTYGNYWHLKHKGALVQPGDTVVQGQLIGLSGNTGYSAFPHLHFEVTRGFTPGNHQVPTRFQTKKGKRYLKPLRWYTCI